MTAHALTIRANHFLIQGGTLSAGQKSNLARQLLAARSTPEDARRFKQGVNAPEYLRAQRQPDDTRVMYPLFYVPPYNGGKKLQTVIPMSPQTHILSANSYELEILRLLCLLAPEEESVRDMTARTVSRLRTTCFAAQGCHHGECFHAALIALRFLITAAPEDEAWLRRLVAYWNQYNGETRRHSGTVWYYWLCLSELPLRIAAPELIRLADELAARLQKSYVMKSENDKTHNPVLLCVLRNCLARLPMYEHIKNRQPFISEKDGRLHFDWSDAQGGGALRTNPVNPS